MTSSHFSRPPSLIEHTVEVLRTAILQGSWVERLPGERDLSELLQVSRPTLRAALTTLEREGWLAVRQGLQRSILRKPLESGSRSPQVIGFLSSVPLQETVPQAQAWMDRLRVILAREGYEIEVHCGRRWYGRTPERELAALTHEAPAAAWVLFVSSLEMQRWFETRGIPAVVSGSVHPGIQLPSVDSDHRATCRHAAGRFVALGHRTLVFLRPGPPSAGDLESERGLRDGIKDVPDAVLWVAEHEGSPEGIRRAVTKILRRSPAPTAFLTARAHEVLCVASELIRRGVRIPQDASVMCRDSDHFLHYFSPQIARYSADPRMHAQRLAKLVLRVARQGAGLLPQVRFLPRFSPGESLGPVS